MKNLTMLLLMGLLSFATAGCNTAHGIGEDIESVGDGIQDAIDDD